MSVNLSDVIDTLRLFTDSMDFSESTGDGWAALATLLKCVWPTEKDAHAKYALAHWMLRISSPKIRINFIEERYAQLLNLAFVLQDGLPRLLLDLGDERAVDAVERIGGYTVLQTDIGLGVNLCRELLTRGTNLHILGFDPRFSPQPESPTSLAMYSSWAFAYWRDGLYDMRVDLEDFVNQEMKQSPLLKAGWKSRTLLALFKRDFQPDFKLVSTRRCSDCSTVPLVMKVQPHWLHSLETIKRGEDPDSPSESKSRTHKELDESISSLPEKRHNPKLHSSNERSKRRNSSRELHCGNSASFSSQLDLPETGIQDAPDQNPTKHANRSTCSYASNEIVCVKCWLHYKRTGRRTHCTLLGS